MNHTFFTEPVKQALSSHFGENIEVERFEPVLGGDIHQSYSLYLNSGDRVFLKLNSHDKLPLFEQERQALEAIAAQAIIRCPKPIAFGRETDQAFLIMEWLDLSSRGDHAALGEKLAALHRCAGERYGWQDDNFIGVSPQINRWNENWAAFWRECRLVPQLDIAEKNGFSSKIKSLRTSLLAASDALLAKHNPAPSLLHGDLWGGNKAFVDGEPVIFDPASYYGDRETDIAFSRLFGGFESSFYQAYHKAWRLPEGYEQRAILYNLYHQLNHLNLFGDAYLGACIESSKNIIQSV